MICGPSHPRPLSAFRPNSRNFYLASSPCFIFPGTASSSSSSKFPSSSFVLGKLFLCFHFFSKFALSFLHPPPPLPIFLQSSLLLLLLEGPFLPPTLSPLSRVHWQTLLSSRRGRGIHSLAAPCDFDTTVNNPGHSSAGHIGS